MSTRVAVLRWRYLAGIGLVWGGLVLGLLERPDALGQATDPEAAQTPGTALRWRLQPGQKLRVKIEQQSQTETSVNARPVVMKVDMLFEMLWTVEAVDPGAARLTQEFTRVAMSATAPGVEPIAYDSEKHKNPTGAAAEIARGITPLLGAKFELRMSERGEIVEVTIPEATEAALAAIPASSRVKSLLAKPVLSDTLRQATIVLPEAAIPVGHQWTTDSETATGIGKLRLKNVYTYRGPLPDGDEAAEQIAIETTAALEPGVGSRVRLKEHSQSGMVLFDSQLGRLVSGEMRQRMTTEQRYRELTILVTTETTTRSSLTEVADTK